MKSIFHSTPRSRRAKPQPQHEAQAESPSAFFQHKLTINAPNDQYEREADAVADQVVNEQNSKAAGLNGQATIQRKPISQIQRLATPAEEKMPATNDARMAEDKMIQEKPEIQRMDAPKEEEKPVQKMDAPEEEEKPIQKMDAPKEEEKPVQKMDAPKEEEKPIQKADEKEKLQAKEEKEEPLQAKSQGGTSQASPNFSARLSARKGQGSSLPKAARAQMEQGIGADFSQVRIHTDSEAVDMNKEISAQAFTHGQDVYFNQGKFSPESTDGKRLLAHELTHVVQQGGGKDNGLQRDAETNSTGAYTGNYIFHPGRGDMSATFFRMVKRNVSDGTLSDDEIAALRSNAIDRNGTIFHAEHLLMAAMRNSVNVTAMQAHRNGPLTIPMANISRIDQDYIANFGREALPADVTALTTRRADAAAGRSSESVETIDQEIRNVVEQHILNIAGRQFSEQASKLTIQANFSQPTVPLPDVLNAMLNAASDSTPGDKVMAGIVYVVAKQAGHPMADRIKSGSLKVDALIPRVYKRIIGGGDASYQYSTDTDRRKADTLYIPTSIDIFQLDDRALIIHELTHAVDDFAITRGQQQIDSLLLETHAYKEQSKYIMDQVITGGPSATGLLNTASAFAHAKRLFYWSMVAAAKENESRFRDVLIRINTNRPMRETESTTRTHLGMSQTDLDNRVRAELLAFRENGRQIYHEGTTRVDGAAGQNFQP